MTNRREELSREESLRLLGAVPMGRVVFTLRALPAIRPVNHIVDDGDVIFRTRYDSALAPAAGSIIVAYEADEIDRCSHSGWSVIVTGATERVTDSDQIERYRHRIRTWYDPGPADVVVRIRTAFVTGIRLVPERGCPGAGRVRAAG